MQWSKGKIQQAQHRAEGPYNDRRPTTPRTQSYYPAVRAKKTIISLLCPDGARGC